MNVRLVYGWAANKRLVTTAKYKDGFMAHIEDDNYDFKGLIECLRKVFAYIRDLREKSPIAAEIQNPRIPSRFSENLAMFLLQKGEIRLGRKLVRIRLDRKKADVVAVDDAGQEIKIEVKATGKNNFQYFGKKDVQADYLVWLDFGDLFENTMSTEIDIYILQPKLHNLQPRKIDLRRLSRVVPSQSLVTHRVDLSKFGFC
ncbi:MAG: hypothetical protein D6732_25430 [Methanobacteriota archaeon]|nr:MAG: hypothetical protein D6732_25430 [Euryarchaeota archaeon]